MLMSELRDLLDRNIQIFGDLPIVGGYLSDDTTPRQVSILNESSETTNNPDDAVAAFLE